MNVFSLSPPAEFDRAAPWVDLEELRQYLRVGEGEESILGVMLRAAMYDFEGECKQPLFEREYTVSLSSFDTGVFPAFIIGDVTATYKQSGVTDPITVLSDSLVLDGNQVSFVDSLASLSGVMGVTITAKLGFAPPPVLPENIQLALWMTVSDYYDNRGNGVRQLPTAAIALLTQYKRITC